MDRGVNERDRCCGAQICIKQKKAEKFLVDMIDSEIYIIGVNHAKEKDGKKIHSEAVNIRPDVFFIEKFRRGIGARKMLLTFLVSPALLIGYALVYVSYILIAFYGKMTRGEFGLADTVYTRKAANEVGAQIYSIDDDLHEIVTSGNPGWALFSWAILLLFLFLFVSALQYGLSFSLLLMATFSLLLMAIFLACCGAYFSVFVYRGIPSRNAHMTSRIETVMKDKSFKKAFLITGSKHRNDFVERLAKNFKVKTL